MANVRKLTRDKDKIVRTPLGGLRLKLQLSDADMAEFKRRRMVPRWINDRDGRVEQAKDGGYSFVDRKYVKSLGQSALGEGNTALDSRVSKVVTKGNDLVMESVLMEISKKDYDADQKAKQDRLLESEAALIQGHAGGANVVNQYGTGVTFTSTR